MRQPLASCRARAALAFICLALLGVAFATRRTCSDDKNVELERNLVERPPTGQVLDALTRRVQGLTVNSSVSHGLFDVPTAFFADWFAYDWSYWGAFTQPDDRVREEVKQYTRTTLAKWMQYPNFNALKNAGYKRPRAQMIADTQIAHLFQERVPQRRTEERFAAAGGEFLLGRYEVLCAVADANFDFEWKEIKRSPFIFVAHAAALNVGEIQNQTVTAYDFNDFAKNRNEFDQRRYVEAMGRIVRLIMRAARFLLVKDLVFFPFGMGAFLRNLKDLDNRYKNKNAMQRLREHLARAFVDAFASTPEIRIHVCLAFTPADTEYVNDEMLGNTAAFLSAFRAKGAEYFQNVPTLWPDADSLQVALMLAARSSDRKENVMLVNGANRKRIGNHWYDKGAARAIDENLHRRSAVLSAISYYVNKGLTQQTYGRWDLQNQVRAMRRGGVHQV